jgi:hypothetical protein
MVTFSLSAPCPQVPPVWPCHCRRGLYSDEWKGDDSAAISGKAQSKPMKDLITIAVFEQSFIMVPFAHESNALQMRQPGTSNLVITGDSGYNEMPI